MNYFKSLKAHDRWARLNFKRAIIAGINAMGHDNDTEKKAAINGNYHKRCFDLIQDKKRKLTKKEKEKIYKDAKMWIECKMKYGKGYNGEDFDCYRILKRKKRRL